MSLCPRPSHKWQVCGWRASHPEEMPSVWRGLVIHLPVLHSSLGREVGGWPSSLGLLQSQAGCSRQGCLVCPAAIAEPCPYTRRTRGGSAIHKHVCQDLLGRRLASDADPPGGGCGTLGPSP